MSGMEIEMPSIEQLEEELRKETKRQNFRRGLRNTFFALLVVAAAAVIIAVLILPVMRIRGESMSGTLEDGDIVVSLNDKKYETGDVIGFYYDDSILIKRVIAAAGDLVDIDHEGNVFVNGALLDEPYVRGKAMGDCSIGLPCRVPDGRCFVMGDHRETSIDSRSSGVGCIADDMVVGRLLFRIWPLERMGTIR